MKGVSSDVAYDYIRRRILTGEYPPGHSLTTSVLSEEIGLSRTPVRDALRQLEADGLVIIRTHLGASVKSMDATEFREWCVVRLALEGYSAGLAAENRTEGDLREMAVALEAMGKLTEAIVASGNYVEQQFIDLTRHDVRFHIAIITAAKNAQMRKEILRLHLINRIVSRPDPGGEGGDGLSGKAERDAERLKALASHDEIYQAILRRDSSAAKRAMESHIQHIIYQYLKRSTREDLVVPTKPLSDDELYYTS